MMVKQFITHGINDDNQQKVKGNMQNKSALKRYILWITGVKISYWKKSEIKLLSLALIIKLWNKLNRKCWSNTVNDNIIKLKQE